MIIDCHGHYTTAPDALGQYRERQKAELRNDPLHRHVKGGLDVTDDQIRESLEGAQLRLQRERDTDLTIFSPRASWMGHHIGNESTSIAWTEHCNDLIHRITRLYPANFAGVAQLPQTPRGAARRLHPRAGTLRQRARLRRLQPEPGPQRRLLDRPAIGRPLVVSLLREDGGTRCARDDPRERRLQPRLPHHRLPLPRGGHHGGDADDHTVRPCSGTSRPSSSSFRTAAAPSPYHWRPLPGARRHDGKPPLAELILNNVWFDTMRVPPARDRSAALEVIPAGNILFASEMVGAVRGIDPETGHYFDDTKRYIDASALDDTDRAKIFEGKRAPGLQPAGGVAPGRYRIFTCRVAQKVSAPACGCSATCREAGPKRRVPSAKSPAVPASTRLANGSPMATDRTLTATGAPERTRRPDAEQIATPVVEPARYEADAAGPRVALRRGRQCVVGHVPAWRHRPRRACRHRGSATRRSRHHTAVDAPTCGLRDAAGRRPRPSGLRKSAAVRRAGRRTAAQTQGEESTLAFRRPTGASRPRSRVPNPMDSAGLP